MASFDLVRNTATELQELLSRGEITSTRLVKETLAQIDTHNHQGLKLRAVISVAPESIVLEAAAKLDAERAAGKLRGPLHGIPVLLKDAILTHPELGMPTTVGTYSLMNAKAKRNARVVDKLVASGLIIIGKTNLNELASWKSMGSSNGWSAVGGQTTSAFVGGKFDYSDGAMGHTNPCGASTGSAVGISAGFSSVALGTEVDGSLVQPAARAALYALKPTIGASDLDGVFAVSDDFDSLGAMAKSTRDLALMTELVLTSEARSKLPEDGYVSFFRKDFDGMRIGFADQKTWSWPENLQPQYGNSREQLDEGYMNVIKKVEANNGNAVTSIAIPPASEYMLDGAPAIITACRYKFKDQVDEFLSLFDSKDVKTAADIAKYIAENPDKELPSDFPEQGRLLDTLKNPINEATYSKALAHCRHVGRALSIDKAVKENNLDVVAFPMDSPCPRVAAAAGYPMATVPIGVLDNNGRPFGLGIVAQTGREDLLIKFMSAYEAVSDPRPVPSSLRP